jgi:tetratricopeptide (TPR) repeat protein
MAKRKQKNISQNDDSSPQAPEIPIEHAQDNSTAKLPAQDTNINSPASATNNDNNQFNSIHIQSHKQLSEYEIFAGDNDFYKLLLENQIQPASHTEKSHPKSSVNASRFLPVTVFQKVLIGGIFMTALIFAYGVLGTSTRNKQPKPAEANNLKPILSHPEASPVTKVVEGPNISPKSEPAVAKTQEPKSTVEELKKSNDTPVVSQQSTTVSQPLSLEVARKFYNQKNYTQASATYNQLYQALAGSDDLTGDFLRLQMGFCAENSADCEKAGQLYLQVCESRSPVIRIVANYRLSLIEIQRKRYLNARNRAYKALALTKAVAFTNDWALSFECDCYFLAAQCLTQNILSLDNTSSSDQSGLPTDVQLWGKAAAAANPFIDLNESQLQKLLNCGVEQLAKGLLAPDIHQVQNSEIKPQDANSESNTQYSIISYKAPIEQVLAQFASQANLDIHWIPETMITSESTGQVNRQNPVSIYMPADNYEEIIQIAAGSAGYLAQFDNVLQDNNQIEEQVAQSPDKPSKIIATIYNPGDYAALQEHLSLLSKHNISLWRRFAFTFNSDQRLGNVHFAMGLLYALRGQNTQAIAEYKLVANRFGQTTIASYALLQSSKLKSDLRDYSGAREDLRQLIDQYPDAAIYGQAYLRLADVTMQLGSNTEAAQLYSRLYNYRLSTESKNLSALGAAKCYYAAGGYQDAIDWFKQYINLATTSKTKNDDLYTAYLLLGKSYQQTGKSQQACEAFKSALTEQNSRQQYLEAIKALVQEYTERENFTEALNTLENTRLIALSEEQSINLTLLKSTIYRKLGITDLANDLLNSRLEYVSDPQLKARILFELALCNLTDEKIELAQKNLNQAMSLAEPGLLSQQIATELADICLKLGQNSTAITICLDLINSNIAVSDSIKTKTLNILAAAYSRQKEYNKAALAQMGMLKASIENE